MIAVERSQLIVVIVQVSAPWILNDKDLDFLIRLYQDEICAVNADSIRGKTTVSLAPSTKLLSQIPVELLRDRDFARMLTTLQLASMIEHPEVYRQ